MANSQLNEGGNANMATLHHPSKLAQDYADAARSNSTKRTYALALRHFLLHDGSIPSTPEFVAAYLAQFAEVHAVATLKLRLVAIHKAHEEAGVASPVRHRMVKITMQGIRRSRGVAQRQVTALTRSDLRGMVNAISSDPPVRAARDAALLLLGFASALRRSELVSLRFEDLIQVDGGIELVIRRSKTDQEGKGRTVFVPFAQGDQCPVLALANWLLISDIDSGWVFRRVDRNDEVVGKTHLSAQTVAALVKAAVTRVRGAVAAREYAGHSLRAGYATEAALVGMHSHQIREQLGHRSEATLAKYIRPSVRRRIPSVL